MFELNQRYTLQAPKGTIPSAGVKALLQYIQAQRLDSDLWKAVNPDSTRLYLPAIPDSWQWVWIVQKGEYRGTMPKRLSAYFHKEYGIKCPTAFLTEVGNIARRHSDEQFTYRFEFVNKVDWNAGDFGEYVGSCYWGGDALEILQNNGGMAVRFYDENDGGIARAWIVEIGESLYILWNGYGFEDATITIARVVASHLGLTYKRVWLSNNGRDGGAIYINSGIGYVIGAESAVENMTHYDLQWDGDCYDECNNCGRCLNEDESYFGLDDMPYCEDCYYEVYDSCYHCGENYYRDDLHYADGDMVCAACLDRLYVTCDNCSEYVHKRHATHRKKKVYCQNCK